MIPLFKVFMADDTDFEVPKVLQSGYITQGKQVEKFEQALADELQHPYIVTVNSATSGLTLALRLLNLQEDDEVLSTPLTCFATNAPILSHRLSIKWVDVDPNTCNMSLDDLERKISSTTKAIVLVHWGGTPIDLDRLHAIRDACNPSIPIIEDCAHAFGALYNKKPIGTHGNICVFSTQAIKHLTTVDGGFMMVPNETLYRRAKLLRWYGIDRESKQNTKDFRMENDITEWGYKFHMNDVNATIGLCNLPYIQENIRKAQSIARYYDKRLTKIYPKGRILAPSKSVSSYWLYTIKVPYKQPFIQYAASKNIMVSQVHHRNDLHTCVSKFRINLPALDKLVKEIVCIPIGWWVSDQQARYIMDTVEEWVTASVSFRPISLKDKDGYLSLIVHLNKETSLLNMTDVEWARNFTLCCESESNYIIVAEHLGHLIGTVKIHIEPKLGDNVAHIEDVVVDDNWKHYGIGTQLLEQAIEVVREWWDCYKIVLDAKPSLAPFYTNLGFTEEGCSFVLRLK